MALRTASRVRSTRAATGPRVMFLAADSVPGGGWVGAIASAAFRAVAMEARRALSACRRMWLNSYRSSARACFITSTRSVSSSGRNLASSVSIPSSRDSSSFASRSSASRSSATFAPSGTDERVKGRMTSSSAVSCTARSRTRFRNAARRLSPAVRSTSSKRLRMSPCWRISRATTSASLAAIPAISAPLPGSDVGVLALRLDAVLAAEHLPVLGHHPLTGRLLATVDLLLHLLEPLVGVPDIAGAEGGQIHLGVQQAPYELLVLLEGQHVRQLRGEDLLRLPAVVPAHQLAGDPQVFELHVQVELPDRLHLGVGLLLHEGVVEVALVVLVGDELLPPRLSRVDQGLVVGDVLLLDQPDLLVQLAGDRLHVLGADVQVEVHGLLLGRHDGQRVQPGERVDRRTVVGLAHVVGRVPVVELGRPSRHHLRESLDDRLRLAVLDHLVEVGVAVQVVEVLQDT